MNSDCTKIKFPFEISLNISGRCNLNCVYCYAQPFTSVFIPDYEVISLIDLAKDNGAFVIKITGGEPLLHPQIFEILEYVIKSDIEIALITSLCVSRKIVSELAKTLTKHPSISLQVSLDSIHPDENDLLRGNTNIVKANLDYLLDNKIEIQLASVLTKVNINSLESLIKYFYPRIKNFHFMNLMPSNKIVKSGNFSELNAT